MFDFITERSWQLLLHNMPRCLPMNR